MNLFDQGLNIDATSALIIASAFIVMVFFAYKDHRSLKQSVHHDYKSLIVSTGVLGTFIGIVIGLWHFDTGNISASVPELLEGLKLAFITSILGMGISLLLAAFQKSTDSISTDDESSLSSIDNKLTPLIGILDNTGLTVEQIKNFRMELRDEQLKTRVFIEENFTKTNES